MRSGGLVFVLVTSLWVTASCSRDKHRSDGGAAPESLAAPAPRGPAPDRGEAHTNDTQAPSEAPQEPPSELAAEVVPSPAEGLSWTLGELHDIGPAGPASASARGVVMVSKTNELTVLSLDKKGHFRELDRAATNFAKYGRGPALTARHAYWIDLRGRLLRAPLARPTEVEELHSPARSGTRVAAIESGERELVAFVSEGEEEPASYLWASSGEVLRLSPEGATASSVALVPGGKNILALTLAGRTGMSPLHARVVRVAPRRVGLDADQVVWVGPGAHALTEIGAIATSPGRALVLMAAARSITDFGLAHFELGDGIEPPVEAQWIAYPNGIDPAPVAAVPLCGGSYVFHAQPSTARPRSPQELRVAPVQGATLGPAEVLAQGRAFNDISVAARPGGAILVWTADRHTWAMTLACPKGSRPQAPTADPTPH